MSLPIRRTRGRGEQQPGALVEPFREQLQKSMQQWQSEGFTRFWRLVMRMRRKAQTVR